MNTNEVGGTAKRNPKRLLPLLALLAGLCTPLYVMASHNQEACNECHENCAELQGWLYQQCGYEPSCMQYNDTQWIIPCHTSCEMNECAHP